MKLLITNGVLYADNLHLCYARPGNGRDDLPAGRHQVATSYSHIHGQDLPIVVNLGWFGPANDRHAPECDILLGRVLGSDGLLPCPAHVGRLLAMLETAEDRGEKVTLEIEA